MDGSSVTLSGLIPLCVDSGAGARPIAKPFITACRAEEAALSSLRAECGVASC